MYDYLVRSRRDLWAALERVPDEVLSRNVLNGERFRCIKDLLFHMAEVEDGWTHGDIQNSPFLQEQFPELQGHEFFHDVPLGEILDYRKGSGWNAPVFKAGMQNPGPRRGRC